METSFSIISSLKMTQNQFLQVFFITNLWSPCSYTYLMTKLHFNFNVGHVFIIYNVHVFIYLYINLYLLYLTEIFSDEKLTRTFWLSSCFQWHWFPFPMLIQYLVHRLVMVLILAIFIICHGVDLYRDNLQSSDMHFVEWQFVNACLSFNATKKMGRCRRETLPRA